MQCIPRIALQATVNNEGKLPILAFPNGGCSNTSITHEKVLSEIASHGCILRQFGALQMTFHDRARGKAWKTVQYLWSPWIGQPHKAKTKKVNIITTLILIK